VRAAQVGLLRQQSGALREENAKLSADKHALEKRVAARELELAASQQAVRAMESGPTPTGACPAMGNAMPSHAECPLPPFCLSLLTKSLAVLPRY
jgi:hypothetical protein